MVFGVSQTGAYNGLRSTLADFYQIKVRQPIGSKDSIQSVSQMMRRLDGFFRKKEIVSGFLCEAAKNFALFSARLNNLNSWKREGRSKKIYGVPA